MRQYLDMAAKHESSKSSGNVIISSKCLAIDVKVHKHGDEAKDDQHCLHNGQDEKRKHHHHELSQNDAATMFRNIQACNSYCFWNPGLLESVRNLHFVGFLASNTILISGQSEHIEAIKAAWSRRLLKSPDGVTITRIGEIGEIELQPIPQTQFIPLPDALCIVIQDLTSAHQPSTLDGIRNTLKGSYKDMCTPPDQIIYETLEQLVREHKIIHTANGYFVNSPMPCSGVHPPGYPEQSMMCCTQPHYLPPDHLPRCVNEHQHYQSPNYYPVTPPKVHMTSRSCQTRRHKKVEEEAHGKATESESKAPEKEKKPQRSRSLERDSSHRISKKLEHEEKLDTFKRSASMRYGSQEKPKSAIKDVNLQRSNIHQDKDKGEKGWLLSKLFGKGKKTKSSSEDDEKSKAVQHATFSAQFPPPEWEWYSKEHVVPSRVQKSATWHHLQPPPYYGNADAEKDIGHAEKKEKIKDGHDAHKGDAQKHSKIGKNHKDGGGSVQKRSKPSRRRERRQKAMTLPTPINSNANHRDSALLNTISDPPLKKNQAKVIEQHDAERHGLVVKAEPKTKNNVKLSRSKSAPTGHKHKNKLLGPREQEILLPVAESDVLSEIEKSDIYNPYSSKNCNWAKTVDGSRMTMTQNQTRDVDAHRILLDCVDDLTSLDEELYDELQCKTSSSNETLPSVVRNYVAHLAYTVNREEEHHQTPSDVEVSEILEVQNLDSGYKTELVSAQNKLPPMFAAINNEKVLPVFCSNDFKRNANVPKQNSNLSKSRDCGVNCVGLDIESQQFSPKHQESRFSCKSNKARNMLDGTGKDKNQNDATKSCMPNNVGDSGFSSPKTNRLPYGDQPIGKSVASSQDKLQNNMVSAHGHGTKSQLSLEDNALGSSEYYPSNPHLKYVRETDLDEDLYLSDNSPKGTFGQDFEVVGVL